MVFQIRLWRVALRERERERERENIVLLHLVFFPINSEITTTLWT